MTARDSRYRRFTVHPDTTSDDDFVVVDDGNHDIRYNVVAITTAIIALVRVVEVWCRRSTTTIFQFLVLGSFLFLFLYSVVASIRTSAVFKNNLRLRNQQYTECISVYYMIAAVAIPFDGWCVVQRGIFPTVGTSSKYLSDVVVVLKGHKNTPTLLWAYFYTSRLFTS